jgi:hypothetical protein
MREEGTRNHRVRLWFNTGSVYPQSDVHLRSEDVIFAVISFATTGAENLGR